MDYQHEFGTVNLLLGSNFETKGVDAFTISLLKLEKQMRRIFTYLIYQNVQFSSAKDAIKLRDVLSTNEKMYFENFILGIDSIYNKTVEEIYGGNYAEDIKILIDISKIRNKIFHGQVTNKQLNHKDLLLIIESIKCWSKNIAINFQNEIGYDGFGRNSYRKATIKIELRHPENFSTIEKYTKFLTTIDRSKKLIGGGTLESK